MQPSPLISVITPAYNVGPFIDLAIKSVRAQTETRFEYLVIDDGSSDDTLARAKEAAGDDPRVQIIEVFHGGSAAARNAGLSKANGRYISFLDGDDTWRPEKLQRQLELIEALPDRVGAVFCGSRIVTENGSAMWVQRARKGAYDYDDLLAWYSPPGNGSSLLIKSSCFEDTGNFDESLRSSVDMDLWYEMAYRSKRPLFYGTRELLVNYRRRAHTVTSNYTRHISVLDGLLEKHSTRMRRLPRGAAYVRPALYGLTKGSEETDQMVQKWIELALSSGRDYLMRDAQGLRLLALTSGGKYTQAAFRGGRSLAFSSMSRIAALLRVG